MPDRPGHAEHKYRQIAGSLRDAIAAGEYAPGDRLPTKAQLMERHGASLNTVERAIDILRQEGLVLTSQGSGMYVRSPDEAEPSADFEAVMKRLDEMETELRRLRQWFGDHAREHQRGP
jgi:DNA-binding GntR family transcriptional regulator